MKTISTEDYYFENYDSYPTQDNETTDWDRYDRAIKHNFDLLEEIDKRCKEKNSLVGRYFTTSVADGNAYYQVIKENTKSVRIIRLIGLGDDYRCLRYMDGGNFNKEEIVSMVKATEHERRYCFCF